MRARHGGGGGGDGGDGGDGGGGISLSLSIYIYIYIYIDGGCGGVLAARRGQPACPRSQHRIVFDVHAERSRVGRT